MPNSVVTSGGGSGSSSAAIKSGLDTSIDIEQIKQDLSAIKNGLKDGLMLAKMEEVRVAINAIVFPVATRIPELRPAITGAANTAISTPVIAAPGAGRHLVIQLMGWYDKQPTGGVLSILGSDGLTYTTVPISSAGAGFLQKAALPANIGGTISLTAGGTGVVGSLNYAVAIETAVG